MYSLGSPPFLRSGGKKCPLSEGQPPTVTGSAERFLFPAFSIAHSFPKRNKNRQKSPISAKKRRPFCFSDPAPTEFYTKAICAAQPMAKRLY